MKQRKSPIPSDILADNPNSIIITVLRTSIFAGVGNHFCFTTFLFFPASFYLFVK